MTRITCRLTAKNRDQLRNPALGNRVRATFFHHAVCIRRVSAVHCCAELLSQLSNVRSRTAAVRNVSAQLQQLELQLQSTRSAVVFCLHSPLLSCGCLAVSRLWNDLPPGLRRPGLTFDSFRQSLKSRLFGDRST